MADRGEETPAAATPSAEDPVGPPVGAEGEGEGEGDAVGHAEVAGDGEASGELEDGEDGAPAEDAEPPPATIGAVFEILPEVRPLPRPARLPMRFTSAALACFRPGRNFIISPTQRSLLFLEF